MHNIKVLVLEDNAIVGFEIKKRVEELGYEVTSSVTNYEEAIKSLKNNPADIAIMDIDLGKNSKDGIQTAQDAQKIKFLPIIFLTAFSDEKTMEKAIMGNFIASYITKPFTKESLAPALILAKTKLKNNIENKFIPIADGYFFDYENCHLYYKNNPIKLSKQEKRLFTLLIEAKGNIVSFETIEYEIWPDAPVSNSSIRTLLYRLRNKLNSELIETIQSFGCKLKIS